MITNNKKSVKYSSLELENSDARINANGNANKRKESFLRNSASSQRKSASAHCAIVHYHEIALKGKNRAFFENKLKENIRKALKNIGEFNVKRLPGRLLIEYTDGHGHRRINTDYNNIGSDGIIKEKLGRVFGVAYFCFAEIHRYAQIRTPVPKQSLVRGKAQINIDKFIESLCGDILDLIKDKKFKSFKIDTKRADKNFPMTSQEINEKVGEYILKSQKSKILSRAKSRDKNQNYVPTGHLPQGDKSKFKINKKEVILNDSEESQTNTVESRDSLLLDKIRAQNNERIKVDLENPDLTIFIEILSKEAFIYTEKVKGPGGLPVGTGGKVVSLISSGIDSPVASWNIMKRGARVVFVHFHSYPKTNKASIENTEKLVEILNQYQFESKLYLIPFLDIQKEILSKAPERLRVILYRRTMFRIAEKIAEKEGARALITGESLGQVASQTIENIGVISEAIKIPVFRPLIGQDKEEIIQLARKIGTYETSIQPYEDCCSLFTPLHPETRAKIEEVKKIEKNLALRHLIKKASKERELKILKIDCV